MAIKGSKGKDGSLTTAVALMLRRMRVDAGLTQRALGKRLKVSQRWVYAREAGVITVEVGEFVSWCRVCRVVPQKAFEEVVRVAE